MKQPIHGNGIIEGDYSPIRVASVPALVYYDQQELPKAFEGPLVQSTGGLSINATSGVPTAVDGPRHRSEEGSNG